MSYNRYKANAIKEIIKICVVMSILFVITIGAFYGFKYEDTKVTREYDSWIETKATFYESVRYEEEDDDGVTSTYYNHHFRYYVDGKEYTYTSRRRSFSSPDSEVIAIMYAKENPNKSFYGNDVNALANTYDLLIGGTAGFLFGIWVALICLAIRNGRIDSIEMPRILAELQEDYDREHGKPKQFTR